jgi:hypothetical protein
LSAAISALALGGSLAPAQAQDQRDDDDTVAPPPGCRRNGQACGLGFFEATGGFGFQLGVTPYVPTGDGTTSKHPLTTGFGFGAAAGWEFLPRLFLITNYEYTTAASREGSVENALESIEGSITYHTLTVGLRLAHRLGPGFLAGDMALGVVFPFETELEFGYAPALASLPMPIQGSGRMTHEYTFGLGAQAQLAYQIPLASGIYVSTGLRMHSFQSNDNGERIILDNFVPDLTNPSPVDAEIEIEDSGGAQRPQTYSVSAVRLQIALGYWF